MKDYSYYECEDVQFPSRSSYATTEAYRAAREVFAAEERRREKEFAEDLFILCGVEDDPARHIIFWKALDDGHASGLYEVRSCFEELLEFLETVKSTQSTQLLK